jgi:putative acetyltransferase
MRIQLETPDRPDVKHLIAELDAYQTALYPAESNHLLDIASLMLPQVLFAVARDDDGAALGCGALVLSGEHGELKRMYVPPRHRGKGVAKALMQFLEAQASQRGCSVLRLETGIHQPEALGLYAAAGYVRTPPFGAYVDDPLSVFMQKALPQDTRRCGDLARAPARTPRRRRRRSPRPRRRRP